MLNSSMFSEMLCFSVRVIHKTLQLDSNSTHLCQSQHRHIWEISTSSQRYYHVDRGKKSFGVNIFQVCCRCRLRAFCRSLKKTSINAVNRRIDNLRNWMLKERLMINDGKKIIPDRNKTVDNKLILHVVLLLVNMKLIQLCALNF